MYVLRHSRSLSVRFNNTSDQNAHHNTRTAT